MIKLILFLLLMVGSFFGLFLCGCESKNGVVENKLRFLSEKITISINREVPLNLKFEDGYFDSFVLVFPFATDVKYDMVVSIGNISVIMKNEGWTVCVENKYIFLGEPVPAASLIIRAINRNKKPILCVFANPDQKKYRFPLKEDCYIIHDGILEIPVSVKVLNCSPPIQNNQIKFKILSNWYNHGST